MPPLVNFQNDIHIRNIQTGNRQAFAYDATGSSAFYHEVENIGKFKNQGKYAKDQR
jgi:hypothetical protein